MTVVLITGASGQDGGMLARAFRAAGAEVHGTVSIAESGRIIDGVDVHHPIDLSRPGIGALVESIAPDLTFNLAAISSVALSWQKPMATAAVNALAAAEILAALAALGSRGLSPRFVQASSAEIFGNATVSPQSETTAIAPVSPYGASKAYAHQLTSVYRATGLWASSCILYNHESPDRPETFVTRKITRAAARIRLGLQETLEIGSLETRRDWGWAADYVEAMTRVAAHESPDDYVIATGEDHSIEEFARLAFDRAGVDDWRSRVTVSSAFARPADPPRMVGDASRARTVLGWSPTLTFEDIVHRMVDHDLEVEFATQKSDIG